MVMLVRLAFRVQLDTITQTLSPTSPNMFGKFEYFSHARFNLENMFFVMSREAAKQQFTTGISDKMRNSPISRSVYVFTMNISYYDNNRVIN